MDKLAIMTRIEELRKLALAEKWEAGKLILESLVFEFSHRLHESVTIAMQGYGKMEKPVIKLNPPNLENYAKKFEEIKAKNEKLDEECRRSQQVSAKTLLRRFD